MSLNTLNPLEQTVESNSTGDTAKSPEDFERPATIYTTMPSHTTLSTIQIKLSQPAKIEHDEDQLSQTSYATSTNHAMRIRVPSPPDEIAAFDGEPFECPYCFTVRGRQDWKYVCSYSC